MELHPYGLDLTTLDPDLSAAWKPPGVSDVLFVIFSQVRVPRGKFGLAKLIMGREHAGVFFNDHRGQWYQGQEQAIDAVLENIIAQVNPRQIVYYGTSMGGYAALANGLRRGDGAIIAFGVDLPLGLPLSQSADAGLTERRDLISELNTAQNHPITLCWGLFDASDAASWGLCARTVQNPHVKLVPVGSGHAVHDHLHTVNVVRRIIANPNHDLAGWVEKRGLLLAKPDPQAHLAFHTLATCFTQGDAVSLADVQALQLDDNIGLQRLAAEIEARHGDLQAAADRLGEVFWRIQREEALTDLPHRWVKPIARRRLDWLQKAGLISDATDFRAACAAIYPREPDFREADR